MIRPLMSLALALGLGLPLPVIAQSRQDVNTEDTRAQGKAPDGPALDRTETLVTTFSNAFRKEKGLGTLTPNQELADAAHYYADYLAGHDTFSHTADGRQPAGRAKEYGYEYCIVLENLAYLSNPAGFTTRGLARDFVEGWKDSPGHRKNLLDPDVTETGVAVVRREKDGRFYAVQVFGKPRSAMIAFEVACRADAPVAYRVAGKAFELRPRYTRTHKVCRPPTVEFLEAGKEDPEVVETVRPEAGDRLVVRGKEGGGYTVRKEVE